MPSEVLLSLGAGELLAHVANVVASAVLICTRIVLAIAVFAHKLPRREGLGRRVAVCALVVCAFYDIVYVLFFALGGPSMSRAVGYVCNFAAFTAILGLCVLGTVFLLDVSIWTALFCVTAGYTAQNLATGATELLASLVAAGGADPNVPWLYLGKDVLCMVAVYGACYLLMGRKLERDGLTQMGGRQMLLMMPVVSLAIIGFDVVIKSLVAAGLPLAYDCMLRGFHGLAAVATLWTEYQMLYRSRVEGEAAAAEALLAERERQLRLSQETVDAINIKCHDIRHQIRTLAEGGAAVDRAALADLEHEVSIYDHAVSTGNDALDTILTEKSLICEGRGITLTCIADGSALGFMAPADLYAFFGNALDNAIEATTQLDDDARRSITLVVKASMGCASIHVENYYAGERRFDAAGMPLTTKANAADHGFGTRSMHQIAERYGGTFSTAANGATFCLDALIPLVEGA